MKYDILKKPEACVFSIKADVLGYRQDGRKESVSVLRSDLFKIAETAVRGKNVYAGCGGGVGSSDWI